MPHVLIVDDESPVRTALAEIVKDEGFTVAQASDLREAKIQILRQSPDLVLSDLQLPDGSGLEIFQALSSPNVTPAWRARSTRCVSGQSIIC
jgi:DNA-binding response OmpR family regulator